MGGENVRLNLGDSVSVRLIPAWAGKTRSSSLSGLPVAAHPRVGGENTVAFVLTPTIIGSSPRGRGKLYHMGRLLCCFGLIPAWAGKTWPFQVACLFAWAHPRVGGENAGVAHTSDLEGGSSPRGRGKRVLSHPPPARIGLIPAWAWKTASASWPAFHQPAHPRVGGENADEDLMDLVDAGSSPRGRGKQPRVRQNLARRMAHPRVGGENNSRVL